MTATADQSLDNIERLTKTVARHLQDPAYTMDMKIRSLELYVGWVEVELRLRPPRKRPWTMRRRKS